MSGLAVPSSSKTAARCSKLTPPRPEVVAHQINSGRSFRIAVMIRPNSSGSDEGLPSELRTCK